MFLEFEDDE